MSVQGVTTSSATRRRFRCVQCGGEAAVVTLDDTSLQCPSCRATFPLDHGIVVLNEPEGLEDRDYPAALVDLIADVELRHFWFAARNDMILSTMRTTLGSLSGKRVLDVGCGTGFVTAALERAGMDAWGIDMHRGALLHARTRMRGPLFASHSTSLPFFPDFDAVTLFDVIEHLDDDVAALHESAQMLDANGDVIVTVPAGPKLWTFYDEAIGHKRRYDRNSLIVTLHKAGLHVRFISYFNCLALIAQTLQRAMAPEMRDTHEGDVVDVVRKALKVPPEPLNMLFRWSARAEAPLRRFGWVHGGSLIAVARP